MDTRGPEPPVPNRHLAVIFVMPGDDLSKYAIVPLLEDYIRQLNQSTPGSATGMLEHKHTGNRIYWMNTNADPQGPDFERVFLDAVKGRDQEVVAEESIDLPFIETSIRARKSWDQWIMDGIVQRERRAREELKRRRTFGERIRILFTGRL